MFLQLTFPGISQPVNNPTGFKFTDLASVVNEALKYIFPIAGLILLFMLISGGFQLLTAAGNPEATQKGYNQLLYAIVGFLVIFIAYWLIQILEYVLGITVF
jgi:hypothetical protein